MSAPTAKPLDALIQLPRAATFVQWLVDHWRDEGIAVEQPTPERVLLSLAGVGHVELQIVATGSCPSYCSRPRRAWAS